MTLNTVLRNNVFQPKCNFQLHRPLFQYPPSSTFPVSTMTSYALFCEKLEKFNTKPAITIRPLKQRTNLILPLVYDTNTLKTYVTAREERA